jgi:ubiquinone/menaquinone biosynthesis C-methylase UbiE
MTKVIDVADSTYGARLSDSLKEHYFRDVAEGYLEGAEGQVTLADHIRRRYEIASAYFVPWLQQKFDLSSMSLIEVGSGTGSATLALAQVAKSLECYEIDSGSVAVAQERLKFWGIENVHFNEALFDERCELVEAGVKADAVVFYAVLEHMTHEECLNVLALSWRVLRPGGIIVVAETPNRFSVVDEHTSRLPFFSQLPREIQVLYATKSPREEFRWAITHAAESGQSAALAAMIRWGSGISFHEFELAIGSDVHDLIVLDGYEPEITAMVPVSAIDTTLQSIFKEFSIEAHRAFTRRHIYLVIQKTAL